MLSRRLGRGSCCGAPRRWPRPPDRARGRLAPQRGAARGHSSFTVRDSDLWRRDLLEVAQGVRVRQEATDWRRALPYGLGAVVWDSALAFCRLVAALEPGGAPGASASFWKGKRVLELGAGCGAAGLAVAARGARVTLTDRAAVLPLLWRNAALNGTLAAEVRELSWEEAEAADFRAGDGRPYEVVVGTDLVALDPDRAPGEAPFAALGHVLGTMVDEAPSCVALLVFEERGDLTLENLGSLFAPLARRGELWEYRPPQESESGSAGASAGCRLRYLCLQGQPSDSCTVGGLRGWRELFGSGAEFRQWKADCFDPCSF